MPIRHQFFNEIEISIDQLEGNLFSLNLIYSTTQFLSLLTIASSTGVSASCFSSLEERTFLNEPSTKVPSLDGHAFINRGAVTEGQQ